MNRSPEPVIIRKADLIDTVELLKAISTLRGLDLALVAQAGRLLDVWQAQLR